jgi:hypothetical protein
MPLKNYRVYDLGNLLCMFEESLIKLIRHLEAGYPDRALIRATEMHKAITKLKAHAVGEVHSNVEKKL